MIKNITFGAKNPLKILNNTSKTPRDFSAKGVIKTLKKMGYSYKSTEGSHHKYENSSGDVFVFSAAHRTVDPKTVKQIQELISRNNLKK